MRPTAARMRGSIASAGSGVRQGWGRRRGQGEGEKGTGEVGWGTGRARKGRGADPFSSGGSSWQPPTPPADTRAEAGGRGSSRHSAGVLAAAGEAREGTRNEVGKSGARGGWAW